MPLILPHSEVKQRLNNCILQLPAERRGSRVQQKHNARWRLMQLQFTRTLFLRSKKLFALNQTKVGLCLNVLNYCRVLISFAAILVCRRIQQNQAIFNLVHEEASNIIFSVLSNFKVISLSLVTDISDVERKKWQNAGGSSLYWSSAVTCPSTVILWLSAKFHYRRLQQVWLRFRISITEDPIIEQG